MRLAGAPIGVRSARRERMSLRIVRVTITLPEGQTPRTRYLTRGRAHTGWQVGLISGDRETLSGTLVTPFRILM